MVIKSSVFIPDKKAQKLPQSIQSIIPRSTFYQLLPLHLHYFRWKLIPTLSPETLTALSLVSCTTPADATVDNLNNLHHFHTPHSYCIPRYPP